MKKLRKDAGMILLVEVAVVCAILLVLLSMSLPQFAAMSQASSDRAARDRLLLVGRAQVEGEICATQTAPVCVPNPGVVSVANSLNAQVQQQGYVFLLQGQPNWYINATSVSPGRNFYIGMDLILHCAVGGAANAASPVC